MGQYYKPIFLSENNKPVLSVTCYDFGVGAKLMEHSWMGNSFVRFIEKHLDDICASYQRCVVSYLFEKLEWAVIQTGITEVAIAGGVSANSLVRAELMDRATSAKWTVHIPEFQYCTDNAAMVGIAGYKMYLQRLFSPLDTRPLARMPF